MKTSIVTCFISTIFQDTLAKYLYHRSRLDLHPGRLTRVPSQRSNTNSCSANTCSSICTLSHPQLRYLDTELAQLKASKRPLVVSFKRIPKEICSSYVSKKNLSKPISENLSCKQTCRRSNDVRLKIINTNRYGSFSSLNDKQFNRHLPQEKSRYDLSCSSKRGYDTCNFTNIDKNCDGNFPNHWTKKYKKIRQNKKENQLYHNKFPSSSSLSSDFNLHYKTSCPKYIKKQSLFDCIHGQKFNHSGGFSFEQPKTKKEIALNCSYYKSPYDSPEMTANCKLLEENLQQILEKLILYPKIVDKKNQNQSFYQPSYENTIKLRRCNSSPAIVQMVQRQIFDENIPTATTTFSSFEFNDNVV